jgi:hypothetical protein
MSAALQAAEDIMDLPASQPFLQSINATTIRIRHATIALDWIPAGDSGEVDALVVEIASFPLVPESIFDDNDDFVAMTEATTPFFDFIETARHRILAQGDDNRTWYDLVYWTSLSAALLAAEAIECVPDARLFLDAIDDTSSDFEFMYSSVMLQEEFMPC